MLRGFGLKHVHRFVIVCRGRYVLATVAPIPTIRPPVKKEISKKLFMRPCNLKSPGHMWCSRLAFSSLFSPLQFLLPSLLSCFDWSRHVQWECRHPGWLAPGKKTRHRDRGTSGVFLFLPYERGNSCMMMGRERKRVSYDRLGFLCHWRVIPFFRPTAPGLQPFEKIARMPRSFLSLFTSHVEV